ncbi:MAG: phospho-N-acetylmuramoyl-pentapeptide-transferase [Clostridia bacterium]|nr:phospho-N-acetylmuramoyl-pentapeptide-transferase [Clostridia bacterium]
MINIEHSYLLYPFLLAFLVCLVCGPFIIKMMQRLRFGQQVRDDGPASHLKKQNVPTMGGIMIVLAICVCAAVFGFTSNALFALLATVGYGLIGFLDDFIKIVKKRSLGLKAYQKIIGQFLIALIVSYHAYVNIGSDVFVPFVGNVDFGIWYIPFAMFVIIAITNGENLADGLDGLASRMTLVQGVTIAILAASVYTGQGNSQVAMLSSAMAGACLGFLRFNSYPARIFMGDTGSLALGGCVAICALFSKMALLLPIMCVMLVATCVSVILQVGSFKLRHGKRIFKMAPLHHHYELLGYHETTVTAMYTLITIVSCALALILAVEFK